MGSQRVGHHWATFTQFFLRWIEHYLGYSVVVEEWIYFHLDFQFIKYLSSISLRLFEEGNSLVVQWLGLWAFTAKSRFTSSVPHQESKIPQAVWCSQKKKRRQLFEEDSWNISVRWENLHESIWSKCTLEVAHQWHMGTTETTDHSLAQIKFIGFLNWVHS